MVSGRGRFRLSWPTEPCRASRRRGDCIPGRGMSALADAFGLTRALVALETPTGSEGPATDLLDGALRRAGYRTVRQTVTPGRDNLLAYGEPTENRLSIGQKGSLRVDLRATGRAAHSAYPDEGLSAIAILLDTIERIRRLPLPDDPLLGVSTLN